jgi:hypothetical protein
MARWALFGGRARLVVCVPIAVACAATPTTDPTAGGPSATALVTEVALGQEFRLKNGDSAAIGGEGLTLRFNRVTTDARCPVGDPCQTEGDAVVEVTVRQPPNEPTTIQLHTDPKLQTEGAYLHYRVKLVRLEPRPVGEQPVPLPQYTATFVVSAVQRSTSAEET